MPMSRVAWTGDSGFNGRFFGVFVVTVDAGRSVVVLMLIFILAHSLIVNGDANGYRGTSKLMWSPVNATTK